MKKKEKSPATGRRVMAQGAMAGRETITVYSGRVHKPKEVYLNDVLNFIENAGRREKKISDFFVYLKKCITFVVLLRAAKMTKKATAFLFGKTGYLTSNSCCTFKSVIVARKAEVDSLFNFKKFHLCEQQ
ncbi:MAG: hypothetical protein LBQ28_02915 [Prevotellaceae bacterium]|nr:hypothetical protein [Prevotellaceae bacterium]